MSECLESKQLTIGELALRSGVAQSALRFYEKRGLIRASRTFGNQRRFHASMLRRIALIQVAQMVGFTLDEVAEELADLPMERTATKKDWDKVATKWQVHLQQKLERIERLKNNLSGCVGCGCLSLKACRLLNPDDVCSEAGQGPQRVLQCPSQITG